MTPSFKEYIGYEFVDAERYNKNNFYKPFHIYLKDNTERFLGWVFDLSAICEPKLLTVSDDLGQYINWLEEIKFHLKDEKNIFYEMPNFINGGSWFIFKPINTNTYNVTTSYIKQAFNIENLTPNNTISFLGHHVENEDIIKFTQCAVL